MEGSYQRERNFNNSIPPEYKPLSAWAYFGYSLLYAIPLIGLIFLFVFAFSNKNINRRNYARSFFCNFLLGIILTVVLIVPLSIFVINSGSDTISHADYAVFAQKYGEFSDEVFLKSATLRSNYASKGVIKTQAQVCYELANNKASSSSEDVPHGENFDYDFLESDEECYEIVDYTLIGKQYENYNFYGNEKDGEKNYITSEGNVFTLPGYKEKQPDGTIKYYVNARGDYYTK